MLDITPTDPIPTIQAATVTARAATLNDAFPIMRLYAECYQGQYTDPLMNHYSQMKNFMSKANHFWFIAEHKQEIIASVVLKYDFENKISKAFGAVVSNQFRRHQVMEQLLSFGINQVQDHTAGIDVLYATTRTIHEGAQALTEKLGFKKFGIFPNSHKTHDYETHCLAATISKAALSARYTNYKLHPRLERLYALARKEMPELAPLSISAENQTALTLNSPPELEMIETPHFVKFRYEQLKVKSELDFAFFPFHEPNVLILSPDQSTELFCYLSREDGYSVIVGGKVGKNIRFDELFTQVSNILRDHQARYVELLIRADKPKIVDSILNARFIPSAFFPAFQLQQGYRFDFVVMSKTFEVFDFQNIRLKGLNRLYLEEYYRQWKTTALNQNLLEI